LKIEEVKAGRLLMIACEHESVEEVGTASELDRDGYFERKDDEENEDSK
jgi:hypothetical protein